MALEQGTALGAVSTRPEFFLWLTVYLLAITMANPILPFILFSMDAGSRRTSIIINEIGLD